MYLSKKRYMFTLNPTNLFVLPLHWIAPWVPEVG